MGGAVRRLTVHRWRGEEGGQRSGQQLQLLEEWATEREREMKDCNRATLCIHTVIRENFVVKIFA